MENDAPVGRRERKKAATRTAILEAATSLFLERGFDAVTVREIADKADVTPKTVFAHFPRKEALVFSTESEQQDRLVAAVRDRAPQTTVSEALKAHYLAEIALLQTEPMRRIMALMEDTPSLIEYAERMWLRHEDALIAVLTEEFGLVEPSAEIRFYARFALQIPLMARQADPESAMEVGFGLLDQGWAHYGSARR
ncbi:MULTISPECIES: TetR/AcrR family transcriptional regulator [unclassified Streptomyces]|uniref:TetR/AcrR family transcriptional regulator n=1 Tax=unclassified Streptomyces TaxID=2593676 RepID=UPI0001B53869|nr:MULTISPECIES: TetR/AcrR family transcriptional regulator [unclassified Streptomyces]EFK99345.1 TetR-family transcriptional regulator [Streptomyces sp. SPB78]MYR30418.1 TetR family transcriptional regulator [Streptomyces sp. SID4945]SCD82244.1 transcriptional regulator, TetR family [Streptomyces sp. TverLS-915]SCF49730.1 transcriptional regulator, TetR family [Streptomyces sp. LcepLS]